MKKIKTFEQFIFEKNESRVFENKLNAPKGGFTKVDIENLLRKHKDLEITVANDHGDDVYFITPYMHINGKVEGSTSETTFAVDKKGKEGEIKYSDIRHIQF